MYKVVNKDGTLFLYKESVEIGRISPEATWVKEGDEFDEEEIAWISDDGPESIYALSVLLESEEELPKEGKWAILGPCKHFH